MTIMARFYDCFLLNFLKLSLIMVCFYEKTIKIIQSVFSLIAGYFLIPGSYLGFVLATNSSKGWNGQDADGLLFIPIGILILILTIIIFIGHILYFLSSTIKNKKISFDGFYLLGIIFYLITWLV